MIYENCKIYGPYIDKATGRKIINVVWPSGKKITVSYPKYLVELREGRYLESWETVDHKDRDFTNDSPDNLQILERREHNRLDAIRSRDVAATCVWCGAEFVVNHNSIRNRARRGSSGPFCSKKCVGEYGAEFQNNRVDKLDTHVLKREYYQLDK